jgi:hypothetical protein
MEIKQGMTLNDLIELSKKDTKYKSLFTGLAMIDQTMQNFIKDIIKDSVTNIDEYYIKTEIMNQCYSVYVFNTSQNVTVGFSWPMADFLSMCANKKLELETNTKIKKVLLKFKEKGLSTNKTNWII